MRSSAYVAAEGMADAIDVWLEDSEYEEAENAMIDAHNAYRKLVPFPKPRVRRMAVPR
jgi:hypothetical protein